MRAPFLLTGRLVTLTIALGMALLFGTQAALAAPAKTCTVGHATAPFLSSDGSRAPRVSGSVLVVTRTSATTIGTPGTGAPHTARPSVGVGQAWLEFCIRAGRVAHGAWLLTTRPAGLSVVATGARALALRQTISGHPRTLGSVALTSRPQMIQIVLDRPHQRASVMVGGGRRASVPATIPATTVISIGSPTHPVSSGVVAVASDPAPSSTNPVPLGTPVTTPASMAPPTTEGTTTTANVPTGATTAGTATTGTPPPIAPTPPSPPPATGDSGATPGYTATQASTVPYNAFSPTSFWNTPLASAASLDPSSQTYVNDLVSQVNSFGAWLNTTAYSVPAYVVPADQPAVTVHLNTYGPDLQQQFDAVPIPPGAEPAAGTDGSLTVWQPSTDKIWDFWQLSQSASGAWSARWGGEMDNVSTNPGYFTHSAQTDSWGATATGLPLLGGLITIADLKRGYINHALAMAVPQATQGVFSWPAQRTDGRFTGGTALPEGLRFRLNPTVDIASLGLPYFERMLAEAAQTYGIVIRDQSGSVSLYAQDPTTTASNPWVSPFDGWSEGTYLSWFPWNDLQALQTQLSTTS
ncbi:MAG: hypothetical protein WAU75_23600 [Solirubrobacteraceae bacterium]